MKDRQQSDPPKSGFSRREFFKGSGAAAAAAALAQAPAEILAQQPNAVVEPGLRTITLSVNGTQHQVRVENRTTLIEVLRYQLQLTGCKPISPEGSTGGSTILLEGRPASASILLAVDCVGKEITTVESLGASLDPVPREFMAHDAQQCGFCTPGFVMAVKAFLTKNPTATEAEIRAGLNSNLCRCGTYHNVIQAAVAVVRGGR